MSAPLRVLLLSLLALSASGCRKIANTFFVATAETDSLCQGEQGLEFPAAAPGEETLTRTVVVPLGQIGGDLPEGRLDTELWLRLFEFDVASDDVDPKVDLNGLRTVKVSLRRQGSPELIRTLLEYSQPSQAFSPRRLTLRAVEAASVTDLGRDERVELVFEAQGVLPTQAWTANVTACVSLRAEVHYFQFIF